MNETQPNTTHEPTKQQKPIRAWPAYTTIVLAVLAVTGFWLWPDLLRQERILLSQVTGIITGVLLIGWLLVFSRLPGKSRLKALGILIVIAAAFAASIRRFEFTGDLWLVFVWRWTPDADLASAVTAAQDTTKTANRVDLTSITADDYPQFLGPNRNATITGVMLPRDFSTHPPKLLWRQPVGRGWSSFAVVGGFAVTQEQRDDKELVVCYEVATGRVRWVHTDDASFHKVPSGDGPRATPTIHGGMVYSLGVTGLLNCLDGETGKPIWSVDILKDNDARMTAWGKSCSPLLIEDRVIVSAGGGDGKSLVAYDKYSGQRAWRAGDRRSGYASPLLTTLAGKPQIVIMNAKGVTGHDPVDGHVLWDHPWGQSINVSQPVPIDGDKLFVSTGYGVGCALLHLEHDANGKITVTEKWRNRNLKAKFSNTIEHNGHLYGLDEGILVCLDINTGKRKWKKGRYGHGQIMRFDDWLLILTESGDIVLVEAAPDAHRELTRFAALDGKTWNHPAYWKGHLLLRNDQQAACYKLAIVGGDTVAMQGRE